uniref:Uncharacterized protein n=1 Tax=Lepeophtheirus salmonis TaxID=72036 RepID=A0A0K2UQ87_LEPSM
MLSNHYGCTFSLLQGWKGFHCKSHLVIFCFYLDRISEALKFKTYSKLSCAALCGSFEVSLFELPQKTSYNLRYSNTFLQRRQSFQ